MTCLVVLTLVAMWGAIAPLAIAAEPTSRPAGTQPTENVRFRRFDILIDPKGAPLAAYQVELIREAGDGVIAGIEGGDAAPFGEPPDYDREAMSRDRIILAAYTTDAQVPTSRVRVAGLVVRERGPAAVRFRARLVVAGTPEGKAIRADVVIVEGETR